MLEIKFDKKVGNLPTSVYNIVVNGNNVGICQLRHKLSKGENMPEDFGSNVYYEIDETERGKGYATKTLKLLVDEARKVGIPELILTVAEDNKASVKVIENNAGNLIDTKFDKKGILYRKYEIAL